MQRFRRASGRSSSGGFRVTSLIAVGALAACTVGGFEIGRSREIERGEQAAAAIEEQIGLVDHPALQQYIEAVGRRLAETSPRTGLAYQFRLLDMPDPNAFALPGGGVFVTRGLLVYLNDEDELASVLGHEIGHVVARHHAKQVLRSAPLAPLRIATGIGGALAAVVSPTLGHTLSATGQLASALVLAPYSREQEREADRIGQRLAADSGWNPDAMSAFMETLGREEELRGGDPNRASFLATHPASAERGRAAHRYAAELVRSERAPIAPGRRAFLDRLVGILVGRSADEGVFDGNDFLHPGLEFAVTLPAGWEQLNQDDYVGALEREHSSGVIVAVAAEGDDPMAVAREAGRRLRSTHAAEATEISGLRAARSRARESNVSAELTWISHGGLVYLVNGFAPTRDFARVHPQLRRAADSFRALSAGERSRIREDQLAVAEARADETLATLLERQGSRWTADEAAIANAILPNTRLGTGQPLKITRPVPMPNRPGETR